MTARAGTPGRARPPARPAGLQPLLPSTVDGRSKAANAARLRARPSAARFDPRSVTADQNTAVAPAVCRLWFGWTVADAGITTLTTA